MKRIEPSCWVQPCPRLCRCYREWFDCRLSQFELGLSVHPTKGAGPKLVQRCESGKRVHRNSLAQLADGLSNARGFTIEAKDLMPEPASIAKYLLNTWFRAPGYLCGTDLRDALLESDRPFLSETAEYHSQGQPYFAPGGPWYGFVGLGRYIDALNRETVRSHKNKVDFVENVSSNEAVARGTQVLAIEDGLPVNFFVMYTFTHSEPLRLTHYACEFNTLDVVLAKARAARLDVQRYLAPLAW